MATCVLSPVHWCTVCGTEHSLEERCPGELTLTGPEQRCWQTSADTPTGLRGYGVLVAQAGDYWRARILTFPNILWTIPGGWASMKFVGRTKAEAEVKAVQYIRDHCDRKGFL